jgi:hypothetical protein
VLALLAKARAEFERRTGRVDGPPTAR